MASNLLVAGVDLDAKFLARVGTKRADVGLQVAGVDISNRYEAIAGATPIANTGFKTAGVDLATLFRDINIPLQTHSLGSVVRDVTAELGSYLVFSGFSTYYWDGFGTITPTTFAGVAILLFADIDLGGGSITFQMEMEGNRAKGFFTSVSVNGHFYLTSASTHSPAAGVTNWSWSIPAGLAAGTYAVAINP